MEDFLRSANARQEMHGKYQCHISNGLHNLRPVPLACRNLILSLVN